MSPLQDRETVGLLLGQNNLEHTFINSTNCYGKLLRELT